MIPKKIHYCWFGGNPLPKLAIKCIKSWKKYCPDYEIIEWNESNFNISNAPIYVQQAYSAKKWAFVTDYVRLYAMVNQGGIYMDTDVELVKKLDTFLYHKAFSGFEAKVHIPTGIMACEKDFSLFREFLDYYNDAVFIKEDGEYDFTTNVTVITNIMTKYGFQPNGEYQVVSGFALYPREYFCPVNYDTFELTKTKNTVAIHWFSGSWWTPEARKKSKEKFKKYKKECIKDQIIHFPNRVLQKIIGKKSYENMKKTLLEKNDED